MRPVVIAIASLLLASACSGAGAPRIDNGAPRDDAGPGDEPLSARTYCETLVDFFCPYYVRCGRMAVDDEQQCRAVFLEACNARYEPSYVSLEDAGLLTLDEDGVAACRAHLDDVPCAAQIFDLDGPCADMWRGTQPAGAACGLDVESFVCAPGTACTLTVSLCGTCETVLEDGAACGAEGTTCARASSCEDGVCVRKKAVGEACTDADRCVLGASCTDGVCAGPDIVAVGEACDQARRCPYAAACIDGVCVRSSELGEPCSEAVACDSGFCDDGVCAALFAQGAPCTASAQCQSGACIEGACREIPGACFASESDVP